MITFIFLTVYFCVIFVRDVECHGRLIQPPARGTMWRYGFNTPANYNDNELNCGGFSNQWNVHDGKCGVCGDPYQGPREHEAGGKYASGTIAKCYTSGTANIDVTVQVTANHKGYFEFRLCANNDVKKPVNQSCLDGNLLTFTGTGSTRWNVTEGNNNKTLKVDLPENITCEQCALQWKYNAGNSWGCSGPGNTNCCIGCGNQEQFYGCADIAILESCDE